MARKNKQPAAGSEGESGVKEPLLPSTLGECPEHHHHHHHHHHEEPSEVYPGIKDIEGHPTFLDEAREGSCHWLQTTTALLALQLGWGLWLFVADFARLGWFPAVGCLITLAVLTTYSGHLFTRLYTNTPGAVLFGDIGHAAAGNFGRTIVYTIIYSLDATRCVILHLAATQSLRHIFPADSFPPLWQCGLAVLVLSAILVQVRSLAELSWVFMLGTGSQLVAIGIVLWELISHPDPDAITETNAITMDSYLPAIVAIMNMVFAFGGQFAFVEIMSSMHRPTEFPRAVTVCTAVMATLYGTVGAIGYWSRGSAITGIVIFSLGDTPQARISSACILVQAISQYLVNLNVWTHNLLVLISRNGGGGGGKDLPDSPGSAGGSSSDAAPELKCSSDHCYKRWMLASIFVVTYSYLISMSVPYFTTLVGLVTGATYLMSAYGLPAWFTLRLMPERLHYMEKGLLYSLIPAAVIVSAIGLYASVLALIDDIGSGGEGWKSEPGAPHLGVALLRMVGIDA